MERSAAPLKQSAHFTARVSHFMMEGEEREKRPSCLPVTARTPVCLHVCWRSQQLSRGAGGRGRPAEV